MHKILPLGSLAGPIKYWRCDFICKLSPHSTWLVMSRHVSTVDTTRHVRCVEPVELVVSSVSSRAGRQPLQPKCMGSTRGTCRDETSGIWALLCVRREAAMCVK